MNRLLVLSAYVALMCVQVRGEEQMAFAFELIRHGARAPLSSHYTDGFSVYQAELTAQGMRQRYLAGRYARERYTEEYKLLNPDFTPGEVYI